MQQLPNRSGSSHRVTSSVWAYISLRTARLPSVLHDARISLLAVALSFFLPLSLDAQTVVASDADLENYYFFGASQNAYEFEAAGGTSGNHNLFIVGNNSAYNEGLAQTFYQGISIGAGMVLSTTTEYNELIIRNGSDFSLKNSAKTEFHEDNNTLTVTGANSEFRMQFSTSDAGFVFHENTTGTVVQALDGGLIQSGRYLLSNNASVTFNVDGADSFIITRNRLSMESGSVATINVGNGGTFRTPDFNDVDGTINLNLNDGGTLFAIFDLSISNIDNFTFANGATILMNANRDLTGLGSIDSGRTVDFSAGGNAFGDATTLNGGTLKTAAFDMANLTFNSGTLEASGALTNLPTLSAGRSVDITGGGSFGDATTLDGGSVTVAAFDMANLTFNSGTLEASGALTNLPTLSAGRSVDITGGGSFGDATTLDGGSVTVAAFDMANLTFNSGTLEASGALTNLPTLSAGRSVDITGGGSFGDATTLDGGSVNVAAFEMSNLTFTSGTLTSTGALTNLNATSTGQTVILDGGTWAPSGDINDGNTTLQNSGSLSVGDLDATNLSFTSGTLATTGSLTNLNSIDAGQSVIIDGGTWTPSGDIDNGNTTIQNSGSLSITGDFDATNLTFTDGSLTIAGDASNLPDIVANATVELTGGGTLLTATTLNGGTLTGGNFDLNSNLTFTSGTLNVSGTLQNLSHLPAGTAVNMSGASADLILSQDLVITGGTLNVDNNASVTVLNDVTLGAGLLGFDSNGGNLDLSGGTLNVASMDSTLTLNANASITGNGNIFGDVALGTGGTIDGDATGLKVFGNISGTGTIADTTLYGALNIGNSPGEVVLENATLSSSTIVALAIEGAANGEFDTLTIDANSDISDATLNITFENYTPASVALTFAVVSNSSATNFANISTPEGWTLSNGTLSNLSAVPEPGSFALLAGLLAIGFTTTRRRGRK